MYPAPSIQCPVNRIRRKMLLSTAGMSLFLVGGCKPNPVPREQVSGTFLQLWPEHAGFSADEWDRRFGLLRTLGYREVIVQWVGKEGGKNDWQMPDEAMNRLFDAAEIHEFGVQVGLPHNDRWNTVLTSGAGREAGAFFDETRQTVRVYVDESGWPERQGFRGWYIPYEIEQYSWSDASRRTQLAQWLADLALLLEENAGVPPTISTYFSQLHSPLSLDDLWAQLLDGANLRPMVQDGVGVAGLKNFDNLEPLRSLLIDRNIRWDLIIELFEELPSAKQDGSTFRARSAAFSRVSRQLEIARHYGADSIVAFAADPYLIGPSPQAKALLEHWK